MPGETETLKKPEMPAGTQSEKTETVKYTVGAVSPDSRILGVSVLAWALIMIVGVVCYCNIMKVEVVEPLYTLSLVVVSFYCGQKSTK